MVTHDSDNDGLWTSVEKTLELWASSLRSVKSLIRPVFKQVRVAASASAFPGLLCDQQDSIRDTILLTKTENVTDAVLQLTYVFSEIALTVERLPMSEDAERRLELIMRGLSNAAITIAKAQGLPAGEIVDSYDWEKMRTRVPPPGSGPVRASTVLTA